MAPVWSVRFDGELHSFDDFPPALFQRVADRHNLNWFPLFYQPAENTAAFMDLLGEMAAHVGADAPTAQTMSEFRACMRYLEPGVIEDEELEELMERETPTEVEPEEGDGDVEEVPEEAPEEAEEPSAVV